MSINDARQLMLDHNSDRLEIADLLVRVRDKNDLARSMAHEVWQVYGGNASMELDAMALQIEEKVAELLRLNEAAQRKSLDVIQALGS